MKMVTLAALLASTVGAQAALQGRDLNSSAGSYEAYYDTELDITWLADANYAKTSGHDADGQMNWMNANAWAANPARVKVVVASFMQPAAVYRLPSHGLRRPSRAQG